MATDITDKELKNLRNTRWDEEKTMTKATGKLSIQLGLSPMFMLLILFLCHSHCPANGTFVGPLALQRSHLPWHATSLSQLHAAKLNVKGAAQDAQEDLRLTIKVIMEHWKLLTTSEEEDKEKATTAAATTAAATADARSEPKEEKTEQMQEKQKEDLKLESKDIQDETTPKKKPKEVKVKETEVSTETKTETAISHAAEKEPLLREDITTIIKVNRDFRFVDKSETKFSITDGPTICCSRSGIPMQDKKGNPQEHTLTLALDNDATPTEFYADTSTEMALKLALDSKYATLTKNAHVLHNQYDSGGVLTVYACLEPQVALQYKDLMIKGAEAGDFQEWSSDNGVKLECALQGYRASVSFGQGTAFVTCLQTLFPALLEDLETNNGKKYAYLWQPGFNKALASWDIILNNRQVKIQQYNKRIVMVQRPWMVPPISPYALHRALQERGYLNDCQRILYSLTDFKGARFNYEMPGHGWVLDQYLLRRPTIPKVKNVDTLVQQLNDKFENSRWKKVVSSDNENDEDDQVVKNVVTICESTESISATIEEVAEFLAKHDDGLLEE